MQITDDLHRFGQIQVSYIDAHSRLCCAITQTQLLARLSNGTLESTLAAIPRLVHWSPVHWPAHWCDLADDRGTYAGDCGVHAALAAVVMAEHGISFRRSQIAIASPHRHIAHWRSIWVNSGMDPAWIGEASVYHEVLSVGARFWDPSEARWFPGPGATLVAGRVVAVRVVGHEWQIQPAANDP
jgi:hypothetical protein